MKKQLGFTVLELVTAIIILSAAGAIFLIQKNSLRAEHRDDMRKVAINAMYYNLEEVVHPSLKGYPTKLDATVLRAMDSNLLKDPDGIALGEASSNYSYEPSDCTSTSCKHYTLRSTMEREATYEKTSRN